VVVDDAFNPDWPGVMTGLFDYCSARSDLVPFMLGFNKVVMCRPDMHAAYLEHVSAAGGGGGGAGAGEGAGPRRRKTAEFMGHEVAVFPHGWIATFHGNE